PSWITSRPPRSALLPYTTLFRSARRLTRTMGSLGENHWNDLPWDGDLGRDNHLKELTSAEILDDSQTVLDDLDDLCVLLLLSVLDRKSTRLNSSHQIISYAVFCS